MKPSLVLALVAASASFAHGDVINRVTLSGTMTTVGVPTVRIHGTTSSSLVKLVNTKITNATVLDAVVSSGALSTKTGYGLVEILNDDGTSRGFFARNTRTGDSVAVSDSILSGFNNTNQITAQSTVTSQGVDGNTVAVTGSSYTGVADSTISGTPASVFVIGQTAGRNFSNRVSGDTVKIPYVSSTYTALIRGVTADHTVINAKLISTGSTYSLVQP